MWLTPLRPNEQNILFFQLGATDDDEADSLIKEAEGSDEDEDEENDDDDLLPFWSRETENQRLPRIIKRRISPLSWFYKREAGA